MLPFLAALLLASPAQLVLGAHSRVAIEGDSNVRSWSCDSRDLRLDADVDTGSNGAAPSVRSLSLSLPVASLRCGDPHMDDKVRESLKGARFPLVVWRLRSVASASSAPSGDRQLVARGELVVAGVARQVELSVHALVLEGGELRATGSLPLRMSDFGVEPPSAFLGLVQSRDAIVVRFDLRGRAVTNTN